MSSRSSSGPLAAHGPLEGPAAGGAKIGMRRRVGPLRVAQLLRPARGPQSPKGLAAGGAEMCMRRRVAPAPSRAVPPARSRPAIPKGSRGRRCRDVHVSTRSSCGPCTAHGPGRAHSRRCRVVQRRAAPAWPAHGPRSQLGPRPAVHRGACGSVPVMRSRRWHSESGWAVRYGPW